MASLFLGLNNPQKARFNLSLAPEHVQTEELLNDSGLSVTLLRNGWYTENYTASVGPAVAHGALFGSAGQGKIASAARADYAEAAVTVLTTKGHEGKTYELAGDSAYTLAELAAEISSQTLSNLIGRPTTSMRDSVAAALKGA